MRNIYILGVPLVVGCKYAKIMSGVTLKGKVQ